MNEIKLNLARKWRSKNFDQIIGQDLCVRILKNSLYKGQFFPVYLLNGQRGSGKTTTARVFAAAINCQQLASFQANPQSHAVPCLVCVSCVAMLAGNHPDFIEMDAASHTGVDNVRTIIEASSYLPLIGSKKIYLIDEAHMLSKAAFNALLKILEEPPLSVIFMLATTDPHKIIDTVRSRCFQLIFKPIHQDALVAHLAMVCDAEGVVYEPEGLALLAAQSEGSARDALNLVERVRFATKGITPRNVLSVLGRIDDAQLIALVEVVLYKKPADLLILLKHMDLVSYAPEYIWQRLSDVARALVWAKYGVDSQLFVGHDAQLQKLAFKASSLQLTKFVQTMYDNELVFARTTAKHTLIEMILLQICGLVIPDDNAGGASSVPQQLAVSEAIDVHDGTEDEDDSDEQEDEEDSDIDSDDYAYSWDQFIKQLHTYDDPVVTTILSQGICTGYDTVGSMLTVEFPKNLQFFSDIFADTQAQWYTALQAVFGVKVQLRPLFTGVVATITSGAHKPAQPKVAISQPAVVPAVKKEVRVQPVIKSAAPYAQQQTSRQFKGAYQKSAQKNWGPVVDVSDVATWQKANLLLRFFPGTIHEITE